MSYRLHVLLELAHPFPDTRGHYMKQRCILCALSAQHPKALLSKYKGEWKSTLETMYLI